MNASLLKILRPCQRQLNEVVRRLETKELLAQTRPNRMSMTPTVRFDRNTHGGLVDHPSLCGCVYCERARAFDEAPFLVSERVEAPEYTAPGSVATVRGYEVRTGKVEIEWDHHPGILANYTPCHLQRHR